MNFCEGQDGGLVDSDAWRETQGHDRRPAIDGKKGTPAKLEEIDIGTRHLTPRGRFGCIVVVQCSCGVCMLHAINR